MIIKSVHAQWLPSSYMYILILYDQNRMCLLDHLIIAAFDYMHDHISGCTYIIALLSSIEYVRSDICIYALCT